MVLGFGGCCGPDGVVAVGGGVLVLLPADYLSVVVAVGWVVAVPVCGCGELSRNAPMNGAGTPLPLAGRGVGGAPGFPPSVSADPIAR
ncbi:unnamed protein product [Boreogadus saida]